MKDSIKKNLGLSSAYQLLNMLIPLVTTPYLSRKLGAAGIGTYSYSYAVAQYFSIFILLGLNNYGVREIAKAKNNIDLLSSVFFEIYSMQAFFGILVTIAYCFYAIHYAINNSAAIALILLIFSSSIDINWFFTGLEKFKIIVIRNAIVKLLGTISIFLFIRSSNDAVLYCYIMSIQTFLSQAILWPHLKKEIRIVIPNFKNVIRHFKPNLLLTITVISVTIFKYIDRVMLGLWSSIDQVGFYESSEKIIIVPQLLVIALGNVMLPRISNKLAAGLDDDYESLYRSISFALFVVTTIGFGIMTVAKEFVPLFYGYGYSVCIHMFYILIPCSFFFAFATMIRTQYILPHGLDSIYIVSGVIGAIVNVVLNSILIPSIGITGAALGTLAAEAVVCIYQVLSVKKFIPLKTCLIKALPFMISGCLMFIIVGEIGVMYSLWVSLFLKILIGAVIYTLFLLIFDNLLHVNLMKEIGVIEIYNNIIHRKVGR